MADDKYCFKIAPEGFTNKPVDIAVAKLKLELLSLGVYDRINKLGKAIIEFVDAYHTTSKTVLNHFYIGRGRGSESVVEQK